MCMLQLISLENLVSDHLNKTQVIITETLIFFLLSINLAL